MRPLSATVRALVESGTLALTREARDMRARGIDVVAMTAGEPDLPPPPHVADAAIRAIRENFTRYTATEGIAELRDAVIAKFARDNGLRLAPEAVMVSAGAKYCVAAALQALCGPGDEVIVVAPYWVSYPSLIRLTGALPLVVATTGAEGYRFPAGAVERAVTPKTRAILVNSPCNPTGAVLQESELQTLARIAVRYDLTVISDEVYETMVFDGRVHRSVASLPEAADRVVTISSVSKSYAMPGWRIGYMAGPPEVIAAALTIQGHTLTCASGIAQKAAAAALSGPQEFAREMGALFEQRRNVAFELLSGIPGLPVTRPEGAMFFFLDVRGFLREGESDLDLARGLLSRHRVGLVPGSAFGEPGRLRLSFSLGEPLLREGIRRISTGLRERR
ncbi:MAG: L-aspartate aminotransferase apoenzyme [Bacteroidetes bacterium]|nr:L-aspartate aminotransferase apoenzyme [Bacteroidota bacterium]